MLTCVHFGPNYGISHVPSDVLLLGILIVNTLASNRMQILSLFPENSQVDLFCRLADK